MPPTKRTVAATAVTLVLAIALTLAVTQSPAPARTIAVDITPTLDLGIDGVGGVGGAGGVDVTEAPDRFINIDVRFPPEMAKLLARLDGGLDKMLVAAWWDGARTGFIVAVVGMMLVWLVLWRREK